MKHIKHYTCSLLLSQLAHFYPLLTLNLGQCYSEDTWIRILIQVATTGSQKAELGVKPQTNVRGPHRSTGTTWLHTVSLQYGNRLGYSTIKFHLYRGGALLSVPEMRRIQIKRLFLSKPNVDLDKYILPCYLIRRTYHCLLDIHVLEVMLGTATIAHGAYVKLCVSKLSNCVKEKKITYASVQILPDNLNFHFKLTVRYWLYLGKRHSTRWMIKEPEVQANMTTSCTCTCKYNPLS